MTWLRHLLHRKCLWCWSEAYARGFHRAAVEAERRERLLAAGYSTEQVNRWDEDRIRREAA